MTETADASLPNCPICTTPASGRYATSPYWTCPSCDCWFQSPMPPKTYEAVHEKDDQGGFTGHLMSDRDKEINRSLAGALFRDWLKGTPAKTLDVGSKYPYLAHCLKALGCSAFGMDNIEIVPEYSRELGVPMLTADFEAISEEQIREWTKTEKFSLVTMIHVFEHMYDPLGALRKLKSLISDDGTLFVRLPDHGVAGFQRDLTPGHYTIHPYFHSLPSILELLVRGQDLFTVRSTYALDGTGQRDLILKPLAKKPVLYAGIIAKNEERDLPRCLQSIESVVDGVVFVDTGSTDATLKIAEETISKPVYTQTYTGASRRDDQGDWKIWDFSKARNVFVREVEVRGADWLLWMDADDELLTPNQFRRALYRDQYDVFGVQIESGEIDGRTIACGRLVAASTSRGAATNIRPTAAMPPLTSPTAWCATIRSLAQARTQMRETSASCLRSSLRRRHRAPRSTSLTRTRMGVATPRRSPGTTGGLRSARATATNGCSRTSTRRGVSSGRRIALAQR